MITKKKVIISLSWLCVVASMAMIFALSMQNAETSSQTSKSHIETILNAIIGKENVTEELVRSFQIPMRKLAHFGIYMLLGFCLANAFKQTFNKNLTFISIFVGCAYSFIDEFIYQRASYGRGPSIIDVSIDTSGVIIGFGLLLLVLLIDKKISMKRKKQQA